MEIKKEKKVRIQTGILAMVFGALTALMCWLQTSKYTFNEFDYICKDVNYQSCMRWFWETKGFFQTAEIVSIITVFLALIFILILKIKSR